MIYSTADLAPVLAVVAALGFAPASDKPAVNSAVGVGAPAPVSIPLVGFPQEHIPLAEWMSSEGWQSKREDPGRWEVGDGALHMVSDGDSVLIGTEKGFPRDVRATPRLRMTFRVKTVPHGTDLSRNSGDDAAFRVYAAFDKGGGVFSPPNSIAYTWTEHDDAGVVIKSGHFSNLFYISLGKGPTPGTDWVVAERDLTADYRRAFPKDSALPALKGLLLKCDSNDTKTSGEAWIRSVELLGP